LVCEAGQWTGGAMLLDWRGKGGVVQLQVILTKLYCQKILDQSADTQFYQNSKIKRKKKKERKKVQDYLHH